MNKKHEEVNVILLFFYLLQIMANKWYKRLLKASSKSF